jgi:hypothetical protein
VQQLAWRSVCLGIFKRPPTQGWTLDDEVERKWRDGLHLATYFRDERPRSLGNSISVKNPEVTAMTLVQRPGNFEREKLREENGFREPVQQNR